MPATKNTRSARNARSVSKKQKSLASYANKPCQNPHLTPRGGNCGQCIPCEARQRELEKKRDASGIDLLHPWGCTCGCQKTEKQKQGWRQLKEILSRPVQAAVPDPRKRPGCTGEGGCPCAFHAAKRARYARELDEKDRKLEQAKKAFRARLSPPTDREKIGGDIPLACPDLPRSKAPQMTIAERDSHPSSTDWEAVDRWHDAYDYMLTLWRDGKDIPVVDFPEECIKALSNPGLTTDKIIWGADGEVIDKITYKVAFIRVEDEKVIPLDDNNIRNADKDPYPGWDYERQGDPEEGKRLGELTKKYALEIMTTEETAALTHEDSRALFNSPDFRAAHPELDGCRAIKKEAWRKARKRLVQEGLVHKPEPDEHYRQNRRWHTISKPYAPGPDPRKTEPEPFFGKQEDRRLLRQTRKALRRLKNDDAVPQLAGRSTE